MTRFKGKERIIKAAKENQVVTYKEAAIRLVIELLKGNISGQKGVA